MNTQHLIPIRVVQNQTGLSMHLIRAWEKRYGAVSPERTDTQRRLYSEADVHRLNLLKGLVERGFSIGQIAKLTDDELERSLHEFERTVVTSRASLSEDCSDSITCVKDGLEAIERYDGDRLRDVLTEAMIGMSEIQLIQDVIVPLMNRVGASWQAGDIRVAQEHFASAVIRERLGSMLTRRIPSSNAPLMISTTPQGYHHEIGAMVVAIIGATQGWRTIFLGSDLPAEEIAAAARKLGACLVALSLTYPECSAHTSEELVRLSQYLKPEGSLVVGGIVSESARSFLRRNNVDVLDDIPHLIRFLQGFDTTGRRGS